MTSVVGIDLGNLASKVGLARNRGIDIIANEVSNRATPSLVAFGPRNRTLGESAKTQETSNFRNTIGSLKRLIGRTFSDPEIEIESKYLNARWVDLDGTVGVKVDYLGEETQLTATQLYAAYLGRLKDIAVAELKNNVNDVVIAVPGWYTEIQRRAVLDAAEIANLHPLRLINETTAIALGYGITKLDLPPPEETPKYVAFVDIGHSQYQVAIVAFHKGRLAVKGYAYDRHFGGRDLDYALLIHFANEFKEKYHIDVLSNKKAVFRLMAAVEKLKKVLSANAQSPLNVESIMDDIDATSSLTREDLENLIAPLLQRTTAPLERALAQAGIGKDLIDTVELVGGSTRVPALKSRIQEFFGKPLSFTCNQDEAVARGATLACAGLSPIFKVREFAISDIANYGISTEWEPIPMDTQTSFSTFTPVSPVPSGKILTFYRSAPFELVIKYSDPVQLPGAINPVIGYYRVSNVKPSEDGQPVQITIKAKLDINGLIMFDGATQHDEVDTSASDAADAAASEAEKSGKPAKHKVKKPLDAVFISSSLGKKNIDELMAKEGQMYANDKLVAETEDRKNALEEYIYNTREKLEGVYSTFVKADVKKTFIESLQITEDWLYSSEGEDAKKSLYVSKLTELTKIGDPIKFRYIEAEERPRAERGLRETISTFMQRMQAKEPKYAHLSEQDWQNVIEKCASAEKWIGDLSAKQAERTKQQDPAVLSSDINKRKETLVFECNAVFNRPPPPNPTVAAPDASKKEETAQPAKETAQAEDIEVDDELKAQEPKKTANGSMDVD